jgi:hypothetical protein
LTADYTENTDEFMMIVLSVVSVQSTVDFLYFHTQAAPLSSGDTQQGQDAWICRKQ